MMNLNLVFNRVRNLIVNPKGEWAIIQTETFKKEAVIKGYAVPLIILMAICTILGSIIMVSNPGFAILKALGIFGLTYAGMYVSAVIINELTTSFNSKKDIDTTFKLVIYSFTAYFIMSAIGLLLPPISMLSIFGLYSIYLFWEGATILLNTPEDNKVGFVVVSTLVIVGVFSILFLILNGMLLTIFGLSF
jgi:hypothetical protein